jgi:hypothetical protein
MAYTLRFSDPNTTTTITVLSKTEGTGINIDSTSLTLVGSGYQNYGLPVAQNFLKLLENFASPSEPLHAIKGQLWYDTSYTSKPVLRINNGTGTSGRWPSANGIYQQIVDPTIRYTSIADGDIWVDTANNQLKIRYSNQWTIVGPSVLNGDNKTGTETVLIPATDGNSYPIVKNWVNGYVVEIISYNAFTPRTVIDGFATIKIGTNITTKVLAKYNGLAEKASALEASAGNVVTSFDLLKNKATSQTHTGTFYIEDSNGLYIRPTSNSNSLKLYSNINNNGFVNYEGLSLQVGINNNSYLKFNSLYANIGINTNTTSTSPTLDVGGGARFTGAVSITSNATVALSVAGGGTFNGLSSSNGLTVTGTITSTGKLIIRPQTDADAIAIEPMNNNLYDIGTSLKKFRSIYVSNIYGVDIFAGTVTGSASSLTNSKKFIIQGPITSTSAVSFNGTADVTLVTSVTRSLINDPTTTYTTTATQTLLVLNTATTTSNIEKISKSSFLSDVYPILIQPGMIIPFSTSTSIPPGFLVCNGQSTNTSLYPLLYAIIGTFYGTAGAGTFRVPNMSTTTLISGSTYLTYLIKT